MRTMIPVAMMGLAMALSAPPAAAQMAVKGQEAVKIVHGGQIRASSSQGLQGFLLLVEYQGKNYACAVTATGQVQTCNPLYW